MSWVEIFSKDLDLIKDFITVQSSLSDFYKETMTIPECVRKLENNKQSMRAFIWRDKDHEINLVTALRAPTTMQLKVVGIGHTSDMAQALSILYAQIKLVMSDYGVKNLYAIYGDDVKPECFDFYNSIKDGYDLEGFTGTKTNPKPRVFAFNASLP